MYRAQRDLNIHELHLSFRSFARASLIIPPRRAPIAHHGAQKEQVLGHITHLQ